MTYNFPNLYDRAEVLIDEFENTDRRAFVGTIHDLIDCAKLLERVLKTAETLRCDLTGLESDIDAILADVKGTIGEKP